MGFVNYEVGWVQMGLIFSKHRILDRFLHQFAAVDGGIAVAGVVEGGRSYKDEMGVFYLRMWCKNDDHGIIGGGGEGGR